ncbi:hypothetical protein Ancab_002426 [Ancistrocladus abbreviatus]
MTAKNHQAESGSKLKNDAPIINLGSSLLDNNTGVRVLTCLKEWDEDTRNKRAERKRVNWEDGGRKGKTARRKGSEGHERWSEGEGAYVEVPRGGWDFPADHFRFSWNPDENNTTEEELSDLIDHECSFFSIPDNDFEDVHAQARHTAAYFFWLSKVLSFSYRFISTAFCDNSDDIVSFQRTSANLQV